MKMHSKRVPAAVRSVVVLFALAITFACSGIKGSSNTGSGSNHSGGGTGTGNSLSSSLAQYLYVANNGSSSISVLQIGSAGGALTQVSGSPFATGNGPESVVATAK